MKTKIIESAANAHQYPLLIKSLLLSGKRYQPNQEIVYSDVMRYNYTTLYERICKLANVLSQAGIKGGDTVAVMDWDSHRYLEAYFAIPMIGAVLHHVNIRLSSEQIAYTMDHAKDDFVLVHDDFVEVAQQVVSQIPSVRGFIQLTDNSDAVNTSLNSLGEYESLMTQASGQYDFPDFDENSVATTFTPQAPQAIQRGCFSPTASWYCTP